MHATDPRTTSPRTTDPRTTSSRAADTRPATHRSSAAGSPSASGAHLSVSGLSKTYGDRRVLTDVSFTAASGDRVGLIGENGTGKSTLLRMLAGVEAPDGGAVSLPGSVGLLHQELPYPDDAPVGRVLDDAQRDARDALEALERTGLELAEEAGAPHSAGVDTASPADAYAEALAEAERLNAWAAEARRGEVVSGLGLGGIAEHRPVGELSGGQRVRLALASVLLEAPHTLLLDEPSNHLDDASAAYLERTLAAWSGIVVVASHDRTLLDAITTRIIDLDALPVPAAVLADAERALDAAGAVGARPILARPVDPGSGRIDRSGHATSDDPAAGRADESGDASTDDPGSGMGVRVWGFGYSAARAARRAELARWRERYAAESEERAALVHEIEVGSREVNRKHESKSEVRMARKFYADKDARVTARRARNARVRLDALERERVRRPPEPLRFAGIATAPRAAAHHTAAPEAAAHHTAAPQAAPGTAPDPVPDDAPGSAQTGLALRASSVGLSGRLAPVSLSVEHGGRLLLTGPNGAGKSTLLAILARELQPDTGDLHLEEGLRVGYLPQEVVFADAAVTAAEAYLRAVGPDIAEQRPLEATGLIAPRDLPRPIGALSVGQRRRAAIAALIADPPDVLLLDEPTNHLSLTLVEEFEEALATFAGTLVVATHDRWMRSRWEDDVLAIGM